MAVSCIAFSQPISPEIKNSDSLNIAFQEKMEDMFENVDLSLVPNGILYDHGVPLIAMEPFRGVIIERLRPLTASGKANTLTFGLLHASLTSY